MIKFTYKKETEWKKGNRKVNKKKKERKKRNARINTMANLKEAVSQLSFLFLKTIQGLGQAESLTSTT